MDPRITHRAERHRYDMELDGKPAGQIAYRLQGDVIDLLHTAVEPQFEGQGLASKLAKFALDDARSRGLKVKASCQYIRKYLERHPEYNEIVTRSP
jgi:predicted GNAT family acetyltransferase